MCYTSRIDSWGEKAHAMHVLIVLYCIVFKYLYSAAGGVKRSEALPVCKAQFEGGK